MILLQTGDDSPGIIDESTYRHILSDISVYVTSLRSSNKHSQIINYWFGYKRTAFSVNEIKKAFAACGSRRVKIITTIKNCKINFFFENVEL